MMAVEKARLAGFRRGWFSKWDSGNRAFVSRRLRWMIFTILFKPPEKKHAMLREGSRSGADEINSWVTGATAGDR